MTFSLDRHIVTSPAGAAAKYCNEYVSLCVCASLSASIDPEPVGLKHDGTAYTDVRKPRAVRVPLRN